MRINIIVLAIVATCVKSLEYHGTKASETLRAPGRRPILKSQGEGSPNGTIFDDVRNISSPIFNVHSISIISMYQVDYLQFTYRLVNNSLYRAPEHGDGIFNPETIVLAKDEYIEKIEGSTSYKLINQLTFTLSRPNKYQKRVIGPYGTTVGEHNFTFEGFIFGFHGKTGMLLQNLGVYYYPPVKESEYFGYPRKSFIENPDTKFPPVIKVSRIFIYHSDQIDSIQLEYMLHGGGTRLGSKNGGKGGNLTTISFSNKEGLVGIKGAIKPKTSIDGPHISQLSFVSNKTHEGVVTYGPFGKDYNETFSVRGNIFGYSGYIGGLPTGLKSMSVFIT